jgi:hypothetical protein
MVVCLAAVEIEQGRTSRHASRQISKQSEGPSSIIAIRKEMNKGTIEHAVAVAGGH